MQSVLIFLSEEFSIYLIKISQLSLLLTFKMLDVKILSTMNKFFTVLLKVILVLSFAGIILIVGVVIVKNNSISYEAYEYISLKKEEEDFPFLKTSIDTNVNLEYAVVGDAYARFLGDATASLEGGIDHFLDYLALEPDLNKGEQDNLISLYSSYFDKFIKLKEVYEDYLEVYKKADNATDEDVDKQAKINDVKTYEIALIKRYIRFYEDGSKLLKDLAAITKKYALGKGGKFSYLDECYMLKVGLSDYVIKDVFFGKDGEFLKKRKDLQTLEIKNIYDMFCTRYSNVLENVLSSDQFKNFVETLNKIDVYEFAGNYDNYLQTIKGDLKHRVEMARDFFNSIVMV